MVLNLPKDKLIPNFSHAELVEALLLQGLTPTNYRLRPPFVASIHFVHTFDKLSRAKCLVNNFYKTLVMLSRFL